MTKNRLTSAELLPFPLAVGLPEPLMPANVDLRDFPYMPLEVERLFGSEFHARANDPEWRAGVTLWLKSFHQVPAASLPNDDVALARLAELGRDVKAWRRIKKGALRGWLLCRDGRLYHRVVAEKALEAWIEKLGQRKSGGIGNAKRWGGQFNYAALDQELDKAIRHLKSLNANSRVFARRFVKEHVSTTSLLKEHRATLPDGIAAGVPVGSQGTGRENNPCSPLSGDLPLKGETPSDDQPSKESTSSAARENWPSDAFDRWWSIYPRKDAKRAAHDAFDNLRKQGCVSFAELMAKTLILSDTPKGRNETAQRGQDLRPQPAKFLSQERFNDPPETWGAARDALPSAEDIRPSETFTEAEWSDRVKHFHIDGQWSRLWGPPPGESGCRVRVQLLSAEAWKGSVQGEQNKARDDGRNDMGGVKASSK
jgi:hypothetical protein